MTIQEQQNTKSRTKVGAVEVFTVNLPGVTLRLRRPCLLLKPYHQLHWEHTEHPRLLHSTPATGQPGNSPEMQVLGPPHPGRQHTAGAGKEEQQKPSGPLSQRESSASTATSPTVRATLGASVHPGRGGGGSCQPGSQHEMLTFSKVLQPEKTGAHHGCSFCWGWEGPPSRQPCGPSPEDSPPPAL